MIGLLVFFKATGMIRYLFPAGQESVCIELDEPLPVKDILRTRLGIDPDMLAAVIVNGQSNKRDYVPANRDVITLVPPMGGG